MNNSNSVPIIIISDNTDVYSNTYLNTYKFVLNPFIDILDRINIDKIINNTNNISVIFNTLFNFLFIITPH